LLVFLGWLVSAAKLTDGAAWDNMSPKMVMVVPLGVVLLFSALSIKVLLAVNKDKEKEKIKELEALKVELKQENQALRQARNWSIRIANQVRATVSNKLARVLAVTEAKESITADEFVRALNPREQVQFIIIMIHKFFESGLEPEKRLRVGVYMPTDNCLKPAYGWDGKTTDCFGTSHTRYMRLDDHGGAKSVVVQAFRSVNPLIVIASCEEAKKAGTFEYFEPDQAKTLKSMAAYRHTYGPTDAQGRQNAIVLAIDTDEDKYFAKFPCDQLSEFFVEMMKRFEYEQAALTVQVHLENHERSIK